MGVTSNGKPVAILAPVTEAELETFLRALRRAPATEALETAAEGSVRTGGATGCRTGRGRGGDRGGAGGQAPVRVVLDTNVLVSGLLSPYGCPGRDRAPGLAAGELTLVPGGAASWPSTGRCCCGPRSGSTSERGDILLDHFEREGVWVTPPPLTLPLPDPDDEVFLAVALAAPADALVTGNLKRFPESLRQGVRVVTPAELVADIRRGV